tara:strand:+ start:257 stop:490 length:234 start_codon:yes stop_codon:yes gene_type:complete
MAKAKSTNRKHSKVEIMRTIASSIEFIKNQIANDLVEAKSKNIIDLENDDLKKITAVVENSITASFIRTSVQIESRL